ncbi:sugar ABC transporter substrate-binding protein [Tsukamurella pulmonis]|uniref:Fructose transport system substrate-binding protein n=1 Tax=Tsukamurella pulmonis TaxID=47312 RepID=A0A1H1C6N4_9ACTN|nr:substrate-binding domain-containing protein [Tsukamurella pulmonis]KXO90035.1 sugar ABC transporter [Tsukamurella pulmonis]BDD84110.1 sugar ABC transporter substrate-binding protein [Tsukamurella pulmonis]SDQ59855.1 fructose transport system substrate-binding protein [Tsukamurella pulmonis]SUP24141.1 D-ribose-binding periplasmic protein precursor [Tsukamurella pulmonis]
MSNRKSLRIAAVCCALTVSVTSVAACNRDGGSSGGVKVGLVTKTDTNPFFVKIREAAEKQAQAKGASLVALAGKFDGDNEGQVAAIENLVSQGAKGILITPNSSTGILAAIKKARDAGVVVIALDTATDPADAVDATFATDNKEAGRLQGAWVKATLADRPAKLLMLDGTPGSTVSDYRHQGFLAGMGLTETSPEVAGKENTNGDQTKAQTAMENLLQRVPDANALYTINEPSAAGGYEAAKKAGKAAQLVIGSVDGSCTGVANVKSGIIGATVLQFPGKMAEQGVDAVVAFAQDGTKPTGFHDTGSQLVTDKPVPGVESKDTAWGAQNCWG